MPDKKKAKARKSTVAANKKRGLDRETRFDYQKRTQFQKKVQKSPQYNEAFYGDNKIKRKK